MAEVQLALQRGPAGFEKLVVVKLVHDNLASQKAFVDMLLDEARVAALVKHPNVVDIYDLGQAEGRYFIAMEYLEGEPLLAVLRAGRDGTRLDPLSTGRLIADTAEGLDAAHELRSMAGDRLELVHHDISLGNIVVLYNGQVKLVDFGVAKATQSAGPSAKVQGKFSYMAPEKLRGAPGDRRSDLFSLGCVMWEALTLKRLFRGGNDAETMKQVLEARIYPPSKVNTDVPPEYDAIVMRALSRDPNKRQSTAKEMAVEIEELLRKRGYGAKNDQIARYMQATFKAHIDARKKLVQEVVAKGSASAEVLDAAFSEPVLASGSPVTPAASEFSLRHARPVLPLPAPRPGLPRPGRDAVHDEAVPVATPAWADSSPRTTIRPPIAHPMFGASSTGTEIAPLRDIDADGDAPDREATRKPTPLAGRAQSASVRAKALSGAALAKLRAMLADKRQRLYLAVATGAIVFGVVAAIVAGGGDAPAPAVADNGTGSADQVLVAPPSPDEATSNHTDSDDASGSSGVLASPDEIEIDPVRAAPSPPSPPSTPATAKVDKPSRPAPQERPEPRERPERVARVQKPVDRPTPPAAPAIDVVETVNQGLKAFVTGDSKGALALLSKAKAAKPGYAPTYRVLGKVHEKLGDRAAAKAAFQRYLKLAPNASDAEQIRKDLARL